MSENQDVDRLTRQIEELRAELATVTDYAGSLGEEVTELRLRLKVLENLMMTLLRNPDNGKSNS